MKTFLRLQVLFLFLFPNVSKVEEFTIDIHRMEPRRWASQSVAPGYSLALRNDSVFVDLPYRGVLHLPTMEETLPRFAAPVTDFSAKKNRKGRQEFRFQTRHNAVSYRFRIRITPDGNAQISLSPSHAETIGYEGTLTTILTPNP